MTMLRASALESLIEEKAMSQAASSNGVHFSDLAIDKIILSSPEFQDAGQFDANRFDLILRNAGFTRATYRDMLRNNLLLAQGRAAWQGTAFATKSEAEAVAVLKSQTRDIAYVEFKLEDEKNNVVLTDDDIATYYSENESRFMSEELVAVNYVMLDKTDLLADVIVDEEEVEARYQDMVAEANSKKEYRVAHILVVGDDEAAIEKANEALNKLKTDSFENVAKAYSDDDSSKFSGGDLGFADLSIYEPEFASAVEQLTVDETSQLVQTRDGQHIIKLLETRKPEVASFADMKDSIIDQLKQDKASALYVEKLEALKDEAFSADRLEPVASALELKVETTAKFSRAGGAGVTSERQFIEAAFAENVLFDGENSEVIELADGKAVVLHLNEHQEPSVKPLASVEGQIKSLLTTERAKESLDALVEQSLEKAKSSELSGWIVKAGIGRQSNEVDSKIVSTAFKMPTVEGDASYTSVSLPTGAAIIRLDAVKSSSEVSPDDELNTVQFNVSRNEFGAFKKHQIINADIERS